MLSVLIPVYAWDPAELVKDLQSQLVYAGIPFEILISDDTPEQVKPDYQSILESRGGVRCFFRAIPLTRSGNRNFLAEQAKFDYLLFLDCDAMVLHSNFIEQYLTQLKPDRLLVGGTIYSHEKPENPAHVLRWKFGLQREQLTATVRNRSPWNSFSTFNFVIPAAIFRSIGFHEDISGYGHEDTLLGLQLKEKGVPVVHLDNGLLHAGLEPPEIFLGKIDESVEGLSKLFQTGMIKKDQVSSIKLLRIYMVLKRFGLTRLISMLFHFFRKPIRRNLSGKHPQLYLLDLYKLGLISQIG